MVLFDLLLLSYIPDFWSLLGVSLICCLAILSLLKQWSGEKTVRIFSGTFYLDFDLEKLDLNIHDDFLN